ncbi:MAG: 30S ribosomal protein S20 [Endomicrobium sp.]|nr:30S ribosomal protein S20 [Endomicrobium sp.]
MTKLKTGRHTSSLKEARKAEKRSKRNMIIRSRIKTAKKRVETAVSNNNLEMSQEQLKRAFSEWDKAAKKNIVHFKTASNQKARLSKLVARNNNKQQKQRPII